MKRCWLFFMIVLSMIGLAAADNTSLKPYQSGDWRSVMKVASGAPLVVHFWGVTCPTCVKEMPQWGRFLRAHPKAAVVFVQVDDVSTDSIKKMLSKAGLESANNYYVVGPFDERLRFEIDPQWHGETPTTIMINKAGKVSRKTGLVDFQSLEKFLGAQS